MINKVKLLNKRLLLLLLLRTITITTTASLFISPTRWFQPTSVIVTPWPLFKLSRQSRQGQLDPYKASSAWSWSLGPRFVAESVTIAGSNRLQEQQPALLFVPPFSWPTGQSGGETTLQHSLPIRKLQVWMTAQWLHTPLDILMS